MKQQPTPGRPQTNYCAYLVRLWQDNPNDGWRASAQSAQSGETVRFADLAQLFAFLQAQTARQPADPAQPGANQESQS